MLSMEDFDSNVTALQAANVEARRSAVDKLAQLRDLRAIGPLIIMLSDPDVSEDEEYEPSVSARACLALQQLGFPAIESLIPLLQDQRVIVRCLAARALGEIGHSRAVGSLIGCLRDEEPSVRQSAAGALGKVGDWQAIEPLLSAIHDPAKWVRWAAADALGRLRDPDTLLSLEQAAQLERDAEVAANLRYAISRIRTHWSMQRS